MKFLQIFTLLILALLASTSAQRCSPAGRSCRGPGNAGRGGRGCTARHSWYYDARSRQCRPMHYLGCGGNNNRWCTRSDCERACRR